jgi:hypothetical protein
MQQALLLFLPSSALSIVPSTHVTPLRDWAATASPSAAAVCDCEEKEK